MKKDIKTFKNNMSDNIDSMDSLMTIFGCELYVVEHLIMCLGDCYYLDMSNQKIYEAHCTLVSDEYGAITFTVYPLTEDDAIDTAIEIAPSEAYIFVNKDKDELEAILGK